MNVLYTTFQLSSIQGRPMSKKEILSGAQIIAQCLVDHEVERVFTIPGAKIDALHNALLDTSIKMIVCRHEQNAAFMAAAYGRLTGKPGVVIVTSGPGIGNLTTGLLTATSEGDPVIAIGGNAPLDMIHKSTHQAAENKQIIEHATKHSIEISSINTVAESITNSFLTAVSPKQGACFVSIPQNILTETRSESKDNTRPLHIEKTRACEETIKEICDDIQKANSPLLILGNEASYDKNCAEIRSLLEHYKIPCVSTFQGTGIITKQLESLWFGRVGLFKNQLGDAIIDASDLIITLGFDPIEYDPEVWCTPSKQKIIHINEYIPLIREHYNPKQNCLGSIEKNIKAIKNLLPSNKEIRKELNEIKNTFDKQKLTKFDNQPGKVHPIEFINELQKIITEESIVISDIGTHYMWIADNLKVHSPRSLLTSNGQQTLGVALPWAIAAHYAKKDNIISISGDGGFLFSAMELETAVREKANFIHFIWVDGYYNMVKEQQNIKYDRSAAVKFGEIDYVKFAESFGAKGFKLEDAKQIPNIIKQGKDHKGPILVEVPINYNDNHYLFEMSSEHTVIH